LRRASEADEREHHARDDDEADEIDHIVHDGFSSSYLPREETRGGRGAAGTVNPV
jgi:hypothetical protein